MVELGRELGFPLVGIVPAEAIGRDDELRLRSWIAAGKHGEMGWLAETVEERVDPRRAVPGARTLIVVAEQHWRRNASDAFPEDVDDDEALGAGVGKIARYARGEDYHKRLKKRLFAFNDALAAKYGDRVAALGGGQVGGESGKVGVVSGFRAVVDTAPVMERLHAARAGIGWVGKHSLIIHPRRGSYLLLGAVVTSLEVRPPKNQRATPDRCGTCARCIEACPTDAITPYSVDATRCISYLTIEHRGMIDEGFYEGMGAWLFGCDICQEVCPHNSPRTGRAGLVAARSEYAPRMGGEDATGRSADGSGFDLLAVLGWSEEDRRRAFERSAMKRATLAMMKRNALIVAGNAVRRGASAGLREALVSRMRELAADEGEEELVRETAGAVLRGLGG